MDKTVDVMRIACEKALTSDAPTDPLFDKVAHFVLFRQKNSIMTKGATESVTGVDVRTFDKSNQVLAGMLLAHDRAERARAEQVVTRTLGVEIFQYLDLGHQDETPMPIASKDSHERLKVLEPSQSPALLDAASEDALQRNVFSIEPAGVTGIRSHRATRQRAKLLQSASEYSMLVRDAEGRWLDIAGSTLTWIQQLDATTSEVLVAAARQRDAVSADANTFPSKIRAVCNDRAKQNPKCERCFLHERTGDGWKLLPFDCESHIVFGIRGEMLRIVDSSVISGSINFHLSVNENLNRYKLKKILRDIVAEWVVVEYGAPPPNSEKFRRHLLFLTVSNSTRKLEKYVSMGALPNGDWEIEGVIQVFLPMGVDVPKPRVVKLICDALDAVLTGSKLTVIDRNRWDGPEQALDQDGLLFGIHGIGYELWKRYRADVMPRRRRANTAPGRGGARARGRGAKAAPKPHPAPPPDHDHADVPAPPQAQNPDECDKSPFERGSPEDTEWTRTKAGKWITTRPLPEVLITRQCCEPSRQYKVEHFKILEDKARKKQREKEAASAMNREPGNFEFTIGNLPKFPLYMMASGILEAKVFKMIDTLLNNAAMWDDLIFDKYKHMQHRALAFRLLIGEGATTEKELARRHRIQPFKSFRVDFLPQTATEIENDPKCFFDEWSLDHYEKSATEGGLTGDPAKAKRRQIARHVLPSIYRLESLHASIRRGLKVCGVQTHQADFLNTNAKWVVDRARSRYRLEEPDLWKELGFDDEGDDADSTRSLSSSESGSDDEAHGTGGGGGGGPWRCFVRKMTLGQKKETDFKTLSELYKVCTPQARAQLVVEGAAATAAHRAGTHSSTSSFGPKTRDVQRARNRHERKSLEDQVRADAATAMVPITHSHSDMDSLSVDRALEVARHASLAEALQAGRRVELAERAVAREENERSRERLLAWYRDRGVQLVDHVQQMLPWAASTLTNFTPVPDSSCQVVKFCPPAHRLTKVFSRVAHEATRTNHIRIVEADFLKKCDPILHNSCPEITDPNPPPRQYRPSCRLCEVCICPGGPGEDIWKLRNRYLAAQKQVFRRDGPLLPLLRDRRIVVRLQGFQDPITDPWEMRDASKRGTSHALFEKEFWLAIAHQSLTPYSPTFYTMTLRSTDTPDCESALEPGEVLLQVAVCNNDGLD